MKIVVLEDNLERQERMRSHLADRFYMYDSRFFDNAPEAIGFLREHLSETLVIALDHDLELKTLPDGGSFDPGTGRDVADYLSAQSPQCPVIVHTTNSDAAIGMETVLRDSGWRTKRVLPFDDMNWIASAWFPTVRRAIVGPIRKAARIARS